MNPCKNKCDKLSIRKAFLFKTKQGRFFVAVFVNDSTGQLMGKTHGYYAFPNSNFAPMSTINRTTQWLLNMGNTYVKRLPLYEGEAYDESKVDLFLQYSSLIEESA